MQLNDAVRIVQQKFNAEMQGKTEGEEVDAYVDAFGRFPVVMEVATQCFADQIIQTNYEARRQAAMAKLRQQQGGQPGQPMPGMPGGFSLPGGAAPAPASQTGENASS